MEHTKCVTELERYSAKGFIPKPSSNKGERKQNSWIDVIQSVLSLSTLNHQQRELVQAISHFSNIPRKKAKFQVNHRPLKYPSCNGTTIKDDWFSTNIVFTNLFQTLEAAT